MDQQRRHHDKIHVFHNKEFWGIVVGFLAQAAFMAYYVGSEVRGITENLTLLKRDVQRLESNQTALLQLIRDVAVLQAKDVEIEKRLDKIERK
jgi:hypothetical protein